MALRGKKVFKVSKARKACKAIKDLPEMLDKLAQKVLLETKALPVSSLI
jgi:hypothetical protein